jgi:hypothetical protein
MLDSSTVNGIFRNDSPYAGQHYPFRFVHPQEYRSVVENVGLTVEYLETVQRTYNNLHETFEFVVLEAVK